MGQSLYPLPQLVQVVVVAEAFRRRGHARVPCGGITAVEAHVSDIGSGRRQGWQHGGTGQPWCVHTNVAESQFSQQGKSAVHLVGFHPGCMAELNRHPIGGEPGRCLGDVAPVGLVGDEVRRELHEHHAQLARVTKRVERLREQAEHLAPELVGGVDHPAGVVQLKGVTFAQEGRQLLRLDAVTGEQGECFDVECESRRCAFHPKTGVHGRGQPVEAGVHLYRVKPGGIVAKPVGRGTDSRRVPGPDHGGVGPGTCAHSDVSCHQLRIYWTAP